MTMRTSLLGGAALAALLALAVAPAAEAKTKHRHAVAHRAAPANDGVKGEIAELRAEVQALEAWKDQEGASRSEIQAEVQQAQGQLAEANARAERAQQQLAAQIQTIPGAVDAEVAKVKTKSDALYIKGIKFTLGGFTALETITRDRNMTSDVATNFSALPFTGVPASHAAETRFSARQSRVSGLAQADVNDQVHLEGYGEFDFLGDAQTGNSNQTNSYNPRIRNLYGTIDWKRDDGNTWHAMVGQNWSLATMNSSGLLPRSEAPPQSIDAQYVVGFAFTRQPQVRIAYDWHKEFWAAISLENPQSTFAGGSNVFFPGTTVINTSLPGNGTGGSLFFNSTNFSLNSVPDVVAKFAADETPGGHKLHAEIFGMARNFYERVNVGGTATTTGSPANRSTEGWGFGGSVEYQVMPKVLDVQFSALWGDGVGRYATSGLPDIAFSPDGNMHPIPELAVMGGGVWHATPQLDIYGYAGEEYQEETAFSLQATPGAGPFTNGGLGNERFTNDFACGVETTAVATPGSGSAITAIPNCNGQTHYVYEGTFGFWHRPYAGAFGHFQWGLQYQFIERAGFVSTAPVGGAPVGAPHAHENILMSSFRYYPFQ